MAQPISIFEAQKAQRRTRKPVHKWSIRTRPWQIQPMCIAPVLPGESLTNILYQSRVVTDPILSPLVGWHKEYYWFLIKHRHLDQSADLQDMVLDYNKDMSSLNEAADAKYYHQATSLNYTKWCLKLVVENYFRLEGENWDAVTIDGLPVATAFTSENWMESLTDTTVMPDGAGNITGNAQSMESVTQLMAAYEFMKANQLLNMSYEDFLRSYGVKVTNEEEDRPELIRYTRDWQYPSNTVDPTTGAPTSAVSWAISERADKTRFIKEPGFIFGVTVARPKVYFAKQKSHLVDYMSRAFDWLPAIMANDPMTSLKEFANNAGPLASNVTNGYWVDLRDLFMYGDQYVNFDGSADETWSRVDLPTTAQQRRYAAAADALNLFVDQTNGKHLIREDGIAHLSILSMQQDHT